VNLIFELLAVERFGASRYHIITLLQTATDHSIRAKHLTKLHLAAAERRF
jgi:hypothetical protein